MATLKPVKSYPMCDTKKENKIKLEQNAEVKCKTQKSIYTYIQNPSPYKSAMLQTRHAKANHSERGYDTLAKFSVLFFLYKGKHFLGLPVDFPVHQALSKRGYSLKPKKGLYSFPANSSYQQERQNIFEMIASLTSVFIPLKEVHDLLIYIFCDISYMLNKICHQKDKSEILKVRLLLGI